MAFFKFLFGISIVSVLSFLIGGIPFGLLIGKLKGIDIRNYGSHNIGATNVRRVLGPSWGILCFIGDFLKGMIPVLVFGGDLGVFLGAGAQWGAILAAICSVLGHIFPVYLGFKGGKGVSTTLGAVLGLAFWPVLVAAIVWVIVFYSTRIVSLASMIAAVFLPLTAIIFTFMKWGELHGAQIVIMTVMAALIIIRHKDNIARLRNGTENKFVKVKH